MVRKVQRTILIYGKDKGFTLIETVIALSIIVISFTVFLDLLARTRYVIAEEQKRFNDMVKLDTKIKLGDMKDVKVQKRSMEDFPGLVEVIYQYGSIYFKRYEQR